MYLGDDMTKDDMRELKKEKKKRGLKSARTIPKKKREAKKKFKSREEAIRWISNKPFQPTVRIVKGIGVENKEKDVAALGIDLTFVIYAKDMSTMAERAKKLWDILVKVDKEFLKETNLKEIISDDYSQESEMT